MIVDLFAGPGGWDTGLRQAGYTGPLAGIEWDLSACRTATTAGHFRIRADVRAYPTAPFTGRIRGLIGSPPCTPFSQSGAGAGRQVMEILAEGMTRIMNGRPGIARAEREAARVLRDHARQNKNLALMSRAERSAWARAQARTSALVLQPARWIADLTPPWVALEQVPAVLPLWRHLATLARQQGYWVWCGILNSEEHGYSGACPLHEEKEWVAKPRDYPIRPAWNAEKLSLFARNLASVPSDAGTQSGSEVIKNALDVVLDLAPLIDMAYVSNATAEKRATHLAVLVEPLVRKIPNGAGDVSWTNEGMSMFASMAGIDESIVSSLRDYLAGRLLAEKSSTMSMNQLTITTLRILKCIAATLITGPRTGLANRTAGCGLCFDHATPQTRKRAILIASIDGPVGPPVPTHQRYVTGQPAQAGPGDLFGPGVLPWVSMAEALGWGVPDRPAWTVTGGGTDTGGAEPFGNAGCRRRLRESAALRGSPLANATVRDLAQPAPTIHSSRAGNLSWVYRASNQAHAAACALTEPAPTVVPGARSNAVEWMPAETATDPSARGIRVTVEEAGVLQGFPPDYPWRGTQSARFRQAGDAIPVQLAAAILRPLLTSQEAM